MAKTDFFMQETSWLKEKRGQGPLHAGGRR
jgi:hypothetical protein